MAAAAMAEFSDEPVPTKSLVATHTVTPNQITSALPVMLFEIGDEGVTYREETLPGEQTLGGPRQVTQIWNANVLGTVLVGMPPTATDFGTEEHESRQWYTLVPYGFGRHYRLGGLVQWCKVQNGVPGGRKLSNGWYYTVEFNFNLQWKETVPLSTG